MAPLRDILDELDMDETEWPEGLTRPPMDNGESMGATGGAITEDDDDDDGR